jgi:hypothetical protein
MKKIYWVLPIVFLLSVVLFTACETPEPTPTVVPTSTVTSTATNTATLTATPTMTFTPTPTLTATSTATATVTPVSESASLPTPTLNPILQTWHDLFKNDDALASLYPDSVNIVRNPEEMVLAVNLSLGFALGLPSDMIMSKEVDTENKMAYYQGYNLNGGRMFNAQILLFDRGEEPTVQEVVDFSKDQTENVLIGSSEIIQSGEETVTINGVEGEYLYYLISDGEKASFISYLVVFEEYSANQTLMGYYSLTNGELSEYDARQEMEITKELIIASHHQMVKENVASDLLRSHFYVMYTGLCPTDTDETYGYTMENPIKVAGFTTEDEMMQVLMGPLAEKQYLETLLYNGQQVEFERTGSTQGEDAILDMYMITGPGIDGSITLYVDMYNAAPFRVPADFGCTGLLHADQLLDFYLSGN